MNATTVTATKQYFTTEEIKNQFIDGLNDGYECELSEIVYYIFNEGFSYVINGDEAIQALEQYNIFKAVEKVYKYEKENFGEVYTKLYNPEDLANNLYLILAIEYFDGLDIDYNKIDYINNETSKELIKIIENQ